MEAPTTNTYPSLHDEEDYVLDIRFDHDEPIVAGSVLSGHVLLRLSPHLAALQRHCQVVVKLEGYERVVTASPQQRNKINWIHPYHHSADRCTRHGDPNNQREHKRTLVLVEYEYDTSRPYGTHGKDSVLPEPTELVHEAGCYSFPLEWKLSSSLPSSLFCLSDDSWAEIRYSVSARLVLPTSNGTVKSCCGGEDNGKAVYQPSPVQKTFCVTAKPRIDESDQPMMVHPELFPVGRRSCWSRLSSCCGGSKELSLLGSSSVVRMGWQTDRDSCAPGEPLNVLVTLDKSANVPMQRLVVLCLESVQWKADPQSATQEQTRVVAQQVIPYKEWKHRDRGDYTHADKLHPHHHLVDLYQANTILSLSESARASYQSSNLMVNHAIVVTAELDPASSGCKRGEGNLQSSCPIRIVPSSIETVKGDETTPDDSAKETKEDVGDVTPVAGDAALMERLYRQVRERPRQLVELVQEPDVATRVQNLSPSEYEALVEAASPVDATRVARLLAMTMGGTFTCQHLLAGLEAVPSGGEERVQLLRQTACMCADLEQNKEWLQQQLGSKEQMHLQAALS